MRRHFYLAIEGAIGVGKTTLAQLVRKDFQAELLLEVVEENPFLSDFYQDKEKYAFQTQIFFLLSRYSQLKKNAEAILQHSNLISDYMLAKDRIFAPLTLNSDELDMHHRLYQILADEVPQPDLVVYLQADTDVLMERIASRDRSFERNISRQYIEDLRAAYEDFFTHYTFTPLLPIDTNNLNIVAIPEHLTQVIQRIRSCLGIGTHQQPLLPLE
ncbi:MAG: deoxynucleoside kinase [Anaerolineae bacterium]